MDVSEPKNMTLKLLIDAGNNKIVFAEAEKDFVDFIFSLLLLPLGSVIKLVTPEATVGSIGKLYQSVENINGTYLVANLSKSTLLRPMASNLTGGCPLLLTGAVATPQTKKTDYCTCKYRSFGGGYSSICNCCNRNKFPRRYNLGNSVPEKASEEGFVKGLVTYMITDDFQHHSYQPFQHVKKGVRLEEKTVVVGMEQGLALLAASLKSATALTDVFLNSSTKKARRQ